MGNFLGALLTYFLGFFFKPKAPAGPSADERLGAAEATSRAQEASNVKVQAAVDARRAADDVSVRNTDSARDPDPYSRD